MIAMCHFSCAPD